MGGGGEEGKERLRGRKSVRECVWMEERERKDKRRQMRESCLDSEKSA